MSIARSAISLGILPLVKRGAMMVLLSYSSMAWSQTNVAPSEPPGIRSIRPLAAPFSQQDDPGAMMQLSQQVHDYFVTVTQDVHRAQQYMESAAAEMQPLAPRFEALGRQFDRLVDVSGQARGPWFRNLMNHFLESLRNQQQLAIDKLNAQLAEVRKTVPAAFDPGTFKPAAHTANLFYSQALLTSLRDGDKVERALVSLMQETAIRLFILREQEARYNITYLRQQVYNHQDDIHKKYDAERKLFADVYFDTIHAFEEKCRNLPGGGHSDDCVYGHPISEDYKIEPSKKYSTQNDRLCHLAGEEDAVFFAEVASRLVPIGNELVKSHRDVVDEFRRVTDQIFADKNSRKAELSAPNEQWLANHAKLHSWGRGSVSTENAGWEGVHISKSFEGNYVYPRQGMPSCEESMRQKMPQDLEDRFPTLDVEYVQNDSEVYLSPSFGKGKVVNVAQGGRWPEDGP